MISFEPARSFDRAAYMRAYHADHADAAAAAKAKYRHGKSKWITDEKYLSRRIVAVDGEGVNRRRGKQHDYMLLAISDVPPLSNPRRLRTMDIFRYLWTNLDPANINVIYGGSYDFNKWIADFGKPAVKRLYESNYMRKGVTFGPYTVKWQRGKSFTIKRDGKSVTIYDVLPFFQRPFVQACDEYLGGNPEWERWREVIVREKARRGDFTPDELERMTEYNGGELEVLVQLVTELRDRLNRVTLRPRRWDGPGAIAAALLRREGVGEHRDAAVPEFAASAARHAYFGGRFEPVRFGIHDGPAWEYDVNSAYPRALTEVPSLAGAYWIRHDADPGDLPFALYRVRVSMPRDQGKHDGRHMRIPGPVPVRTPAGSIFYPMNSITWIWSPEMAVLRKYAAAVKGVRYRVLEAVECIPATAARPFAFVPELYARRRELKAAGDGAHIGIKLGLNSLYGKTCQQVGWIPAMRERRTLSGTLLPALPMRIPPFHQLEWGGYATSWCRARVLDAAIQDLDAVIAFETDAIFTSRPLQLEIGDELGDFEATEFRNLTYVQSGHYYATKTDGTEIVKARGVDRGSLSRAAIEAAMTSTDPSYSAQLTRFYGAGIALHQDWSRWGTFTTTPKRLDLQPSGKRRHWAPACGCGAEGDPLSPGLHVTYCPATRPTVSAEYPVAWINPNPAMRELEDARTAEADWELD